MWQMKTTTTTYDVDNEDYDYDDQELEELRTLHAENKEEKEEMARIAYDMRRRELIEEASLHGDEDEDEGSLSPGRGWPRTC